MKTPLSVVHACEVLKSRVRLENAGLVPPGKAMPDERYTKEVRESMRIYRETWIIPLLEAIQDGDLHAVRRLSS